MAVNKRVVMREVRKLRMEEEAVPKPEAKGLVVKIHYAGVCRSDISLWEDKFKLAENDIRPMAGHYHNYDFPFVFGHEIAGEVYAIGEDGFKGSGDDSLEVGDRVLVFPYTGCEACGACKAGYSNLCEGSGDMSYGMGMGRPGGWQSYLSLTETDKVVKLPAGFDMRIACMMTCGALTSYNAISQLHNAVKLGILFNGFARVLVVGAGGVGIWAVQWARLLFPEGTKIYVADVSEDRLTEAKKMGADVGILWTTNGEAEEMAEQVKQAAGSDIDGAVDFVGSSLTGNSVQWCLRKAGCHANVGLAGGVLNLSLPETSIKATTYQGVYTGNVAQLRELTKIVTQGKIKFPAVEVFKPEEAEEVLEKLISGKLQGRGLLDFINN